MSERIFYCDIFPWFCRFLCKNFLVYVNFPRNFYLLKKLITNQALCIVINYWCSVNRKFTMKSTPHLHPATDYQITQHLTLLFLVVRLVGAVLLLEWCWNERMASNQKVRWKSARGILCTLTYNTKHDIKPFNSFITGCWRMDAFFIWRYNRGSVCTSLHLWSFGAYFSSKVFNL